jgi:hypothetical protein
VTTDPSLNALNQASNVDSPSASNGWDVVCLLCLVFFFLCLSPSSSLRFELDCGGPNTGGITLSGCVGVGQLSCARADGTGGAPCVRETSLPGPISSSLPSSLSSPLLFSFPSHSSCSSCCTSPLCRSSSFCCSPSSCDGLGTRYTE